MAVMAEAPSRSLTALIEQASALLATDPAEAERLAREALAASPSDPRARLILGSARRRRGDPAAARTLLAPLAKAYPQAANTQYELGLTLAALGDPAAAIAALRAALSIRRDWAEAWRALGDQLFAVGETQAAETAFAEHARAAVQDPALRPAAEAVFQGRLAEAEQRLRAHLRTRPTDADALHLLARTLVRLNRPVDAEPLFARCLELDPDFDAARFGYAEVLFRQQKASQALAETQALAARDPGHPAYRNLLAACLGLIGDQARSIALYEGLLAEFPRQPRIWLNYGHALRTIRRGEEAADGPEGMSIVQPDPGLAWELRQQPFVERDRARLIADQAEAGGEQVAVGRMAWVARCKGLGLGERLARLLLAEQDLRIAEAGGVEVRIQLQAAGEKRLRIDGAVQADEGSG